MPLHSQQDLPGFDIVKENDGYYAVFASSIDLDMFDVNVPALFLECAITCYGTHRNAFYLGPYMH